MEETFTVIRLGVPELLRCAWATTSPIESAFSVAENVTRRLQRWREGNMRQRWCAASREQVPACQRLPPYAQLLKALDCLGKEIDENWRIA